MGTGYKFAAVAVVLLLACTGGALAGMLGGILGDVALVATMAACAALVLRMGDVFGWR